ncbi:PREDICTED: protein PYRICULARIA ORYZAE RESISTANCE 21-like [Camelina sativa]|uniref:Protein PYRICULARIA ORYZAE RESISTANCE 21-like n=1 Tax=Camelina sativa TaxID=90675 RepID=A0ABM0XHH4_CAMSA|nr:PREDICTED: protein PYRICULARIA ORYZAE RESISTANCE 21-like [Camelina sativa]
MTVKKVEIKVDINCGKCNSAIMEAATDIEGVNHVSLDEGKSVLTVVGTMDPVCVASRLKKIKQKPVIISVGPPPKPPEPPKPPAPEKPKPPPTPEPPKHVCKPPPPNCNSCDVVSVTTYESGSGCNIL